MLEIVCNLFKLIVVNFDNYFFYMVCLNFPYDRSYILVIPQGTVDNNLGPGRLAGAEALDPNYCRQPTL